ncbi:MAG: hypothetical protein NWS64_02740 [Microbacteriaceae bacterium]|nr:hypothetical protein [Microbacteriaceae bacterium]
MGTLGNAVRQLAAIRDSTRPFARSIAALIAGFTITFTYDITTFTALTWLTVIVTVSLLMWDGPDTALNKAALWATVFVVGMTVLGLAMGKMSTTTALSLSVALVAFETSRAFARADRIWLWSTGVLAVGLSIAYFNVDANDRTAAGLTGGWAIVAGIFGLIGAIDVIVKRRRAAREHAAKKSTPVTKTPRKPAASAKPAKRPTPPTTKAKPRAPKR